MGKNIVYVNIYGFLRGVNVLLLRLHFTLKSQLKCHFKETFPHLSHSILALCFVLFLSVFFTLGSYQRLDQVGTELVLVFLKCINMLSNGLDNWTFTNVV